MTPFKALYGRDPPGIHAVASETVQDEALATSLEERTEILAQLKTNLKHSRIQMEKQANKKRIDYTFSVGDLVLMKLQPYRQQKVSRRSSQKLSQRFFGPYKVIKRVGEVAYMLDLPSSSRIHPVVHVSLLKPYFASTSTPAFRQLPNHTKLLFEDSPLEQSTATKLQSVEGEEALKELAEPFASSESFQKEAFLKSDTKRVSVNESGQVHFNPNESLPLPNKPTSPSASSRESDYTSPKQCFRWITAGSHNVSPNPTNFSAPPHTCLLPTPPHLIQNLPPSADFPKSLQQPPFPTQNFSHGPIKISSNGPATNSMNLEDKVLFDPMSIVRQRPTREKKTSVLLKDYYHY